MHFEKCVSEKNNGLKSFLKLHSHFDIFVHISFLSQDTKSFAVVIDWKIWKSSRKNSQPLKHLSPNEIWMAENEKRCPPKTQSISETTTLFIFGRSYFIRALQNTSPAYCPIHVVTFTLISILATDNIQKRRDQALLFSFEYNLS